MRPFNDVLFVVLSHDGRALLALLLAEVGGLDGFLVNVVDHLPGAISSLDGQLGSKLAASGALKEIAP